MSYLVPPNDPSVGPSGISVKAPAVLGGATGRRRSRPRQYNGPPMPLLRLRIPLDRWMEMVAHVESCLPEEACGFLGGRGEAVGIVLPVENAAHSPVRFRMDPEGQLRGMARLEDEGWSMLGIFHSHPRGPSGLSATDRDEAAYPECALLVLSLSAGVWTGRGFSLEGEGPRELEIHVAGAETGSSGGVSWSVANGGRR